VSEPEPFLIHPKKRYISLLSRIKYSLKKHSSRFERLYTHDEKLFAETFQQIRFKLNKNEFSKEEKENIFCYWICGLYFGKLFRECAKVVPICEKRRDKIISRNAYFKDQLFMKEDGRIFN
jgi:hypothetical protein